MMKIDCEGAEWEIFEDLSETGLLSEFDTIVGEYHYPHDNDNSGLFNRFVQQLTEAGLKIISWDENQYNTKIGTFTIKKI